MGKSLDNQHPRVQDEDPATLTTDGRAPGNLLADTTVHALLDVFPATETDGRVMTGEQMIHWLRDVLGRMGLEGHAAVVRTRPTLSLATTTLARTLQQIEAHDEQAPTTQALRGVRLPDLAVQATTPRLLHGRFAAHAHRLGVRWVGTRLLITTSGSAPPPSRATPDGHTAANAAAVLVHYRCRPPRLSAADQDQLTLVAHLLGVRLRYDDALLHAAQLQTALRSRIVIEQAKGFLAAQWKCLPEQTFPALRGHARAQQRLLHELSLRITTHTETIPPPADLL
ncbi:ANTAR domain-containing protein [Streptomyces sp. NPDC050703]|uniref:ANTAR domain-containing protein n=1 Tax=Streptomyces sp. NPDC050703 TaxID=3157218 RepID=UPI00342442A7